QVKLFLGIITPVSPIGTSASAARCASRPARRAPASGWRRADGTRSCLRPRTRFRTAMTVRIAVSCYCREWACTTSTRSRATGGNEAWPRHRGAPRPPSTPSTCQINSGILPLPLRYRAKTLGADTQSRVEFTSVVLKRDCSGQLHDLRFGVVLLQSGEQRIIDDLIRDRDTLGILKRDSLRFAKYPAITPCRNLG